MKRRTLITTAIVGALSFGLLVATPVLAEGPGSGRGRGAIAFDRFDTNDDGWVSGKEFRSGQRARFQQMDLNGNGRIGKHEAAKAKRHVRDQRWNRNRGNHYGHFKRADSNRDGDVSKREARKWRRHARDQHWDRDTSNHHARLARADSNRDGAITQREAWKARRHGRDQQWDRDRRGHGTNPDLYDNRH